MLQSSWGGRSPSALIAIVALVSGCSDSTAVRGSGAVQVTLRRITAPTVQMATPLLSVSGGEAAAAPIDLDAVSCLYVEITGIHLLPATPDDGDPDMGEPDPMDGEDEQWERLDIEPTVIDLTALPRVNDDPQDPLVLTVDTDVPADDYRKVRLITGDDNEIHLTSPLTVGQYEYDVDDSEDCSGMGNTVIVPSGSQTGLKTDIAVTVVAAEEGNPQTVDLLFDDDTSIRNAVATGSGRINLTPVLRSRP